ncbi:CBS domain-containing protein [Sphingomonas sp. RT2P30]|uniref:CBS domain-containing protein n=1 Tax=Parasphingomonas halimpatiens TaxID=3096162 RepID=UPI002FCABB43
MTNWPANKTLVVEGLLPKARERLVIIADNVTLIEAAALLRPGIELVIVCNAAGLLVGVITKTDIVNQISRCQGASCVAAAAVVMTSKVLLCQPADSLSDVWARMKERGLKNVPVVDDESRPLGLLHARDILQILLTDAEDTEALLQDYVMGVGYR